MFKKLLDKLFKQETLEEAKDRINREIRHHNSLGISTNWYFQAQEKL